MFKSADIIFLVLLMMLAGCATTPPAREEPISSPSPVSGASAFNWVDPNVAPGPRPLPAPKTNPSGFNNSNRPPVTAPKPAPVPAATWTALSHWTDAHGFAPPRLVSKAPLATYQVQSEQGVMLLALGSRVANWNGIEIHLGFEPQLIDGQICLHGLDLQNNLEPLLCGPPLTFGTNRVIVIDPGHGGNNVGTHSITDGRFEKEFTLDWAKRLKPLLETNGWSVFLTRTDDSYVTNSDRAVFAQAHRADVFISLHFNSAAPDKNQGGLETYCLTPTGMPSTLTRNYSDLWTEHFPNNNFDPANLQLAVRLQAALLRAIGEEDRGVRRARFMDVLHEQSHPAILIEGGYLSNPREAKRIEDPEFRQKLAEAVASALRLNPETRTPKPEDHMSMAGTNQFSTP